MTQTINRIYASKATAEEAAASLAVRGYRNVHQFSKAAAEGEAEASGSVDDLVAEMMKAFIWRPHAEVFAKRVASGATLVTVHAPFGTGLRALQLLDQHGPVDSGVPDPAEPPLMWDDKAPFSSTIHMPLLTKTRLPFETVAGVRSLTGGTCLFSSCLGMRLLTPSKTPLSDMFGWGLLSKEKTPLSSRFGWPLLSKA